MPEFGVSTWKPIPFLRILLPLTAGILLQYHLQIGLLWLHLVSATGLLFLACSGLLSMARLFFLRWVAGVGINLLFLGIGGIVTYQRNIEHRPSWIGNHYAQDNAVIATIQEPLVEKPKSFKALARVESIISRNGNQAVMGDLLVYFRKDSVTPSLAYGAQVLIKKPLQRIANSGNPGAFDYKQYCAFQGIHYQVFLKPEDYAILPTSDINWFKKTLIHTSSWVLNTLRRFIKEKNEQAVAEALLIGYRDDLDKELVQSYSNTGVVHIIAISGLHLGMIYGALVWLLLPLKRKKGYRFFKPLLILFVLWMFTFIAGAGPSILRSAVMFSCIVAGEAIGRKVSIYNTLAASAFLLLLYNPFFLWDVGFQLSYAAVLGIIAFQKHISHWFYFRNKMLAGIWQLSAISLAAQVLTLPIVLYHFHQFPNLFLLTNLMVVPLSGLILFAEILLLILSFFTPVAVSFGALVEWMIKLMNTLIERTDQIPFAVTDGIQITILQSILIYGSIIFSSIWLIRKQKRMLGIACLFLAAYVGLRSVDIIKVKGQQKLIVYNVPQHTAIDIIDGDNYMFYGDTVLSEQSFLKNFHLRPSRIVNRVSAGILHSVQFRDNIIRSKGKQVIILNKALAGTTPTQKIKAHAIIITGSPRLYVDRLLDFYDCSMLVFDASNPAWKIRLWKKDCDSLHLPHYSVPEQGAFEMDL